MSASPAFGFHFQVRSSPTDRPAAQGEDSSGKAVQIALEDPEPVIHVFKTMSEAHFGELSFFRVYSGTVSTGMDLFNSDRKITERLGPIYILNGRIERPSTNCAPETSAPPSN